MSASDFLVTVNGSPLAAGSTSLITGPVVFTYSGTTSGSATVTFEDGSLSPTMFLYMIAVTGGSGGGGGSSPTSVPSGPGAVSQEFGKPLSGTCDAAAPASLNWSGVASGGWGESWAQWMNGGNGGAVCTRTLIYSSAQSRWVVG